MWQQNKKFRNAFLVHHLAKRDEIWHWAWCAILVNFGPLFWGAKIFDSRYLVHFLSACDKILQH